MCNIHPSKASKRFLRTCLQLVNALTYVPVRLNPPRILKGFAIFDWYQAFPSFIISITSI